MNQIDIIGWFATLLTLSSFIIGDIKSLRILNLLGAFAWACYGLFLPNTPMILTNVTIMVIHGVWLFKLWKK